MRKSLVLLAALAFGAVAHAQTYPSRPVKLIVPFPAGSATDQVARLTGQQLQEELKQPFIVENKPGAQGAIAAAEVAKAAPDGYTLLVNTAALAINMSLYPKLAFDALRDFIPVSVFSESPNVLVVPAIHPVKSVRELVAQAEAAPGKLNFSSAGVGTTQHLAAELLKLRTKTFMVHIPYRGSAPSLTALIAGEVDLSFANVPAIHAHVQSGRLRALAVAGPRRDGQLPEVPTMKEAGIEGVEVVVWYGLFAPAGTPREVVSTLAAGVQRAAKDAGMRKRLLEQGAEPVGSTPEEFAKLMREELARWSEVVRVSGARAD